MLPGGAVGSGDRAHSADPSSIGAPSGLRSVVARGPSPRWHTRVPPRYCR
jgi:hypothetical protein